MLGSHVPRGAAGLAGSYRRVRQFRGRVHNVSSLHFCEVVAADTEHVRLGRSVLLRFRAATIESCCDLHPPASVGVRSKRIGPFRRNPAFVHRSPPTPVARQRAHVRMCSLVHRCNTDIAIPICEPEKNGMRCDDRIRNGDRIRKYRSNCSRLKRVTTGTRLQRRRMAGFDNQVIKDITPAGLSSGELERG
jgi:hypothetical protein